MVPLIRQITSRKSNERSNPIQQAIISLHWMAEFWNFTCLLCGYICLKIYPVPQPGTGYGSAMSGGLNNTSKIYQILKLGHFKWYFRVIWNRG